MSHGPMAKSRVAILAHEFEKRLKSFAPCHSQSLLLADFTENHTKEIRKTRKLESAHE
jgi:hypothetical protein